MKGRPMNKYDEQYYIVDETYNENTLYLTALQKTANRDYEYTKMEFGQEPLFFENAYKDRDIKENISRPIQKSHMNMNFVLVNSEARNLLKKKVINGFQLYPAVIIDDKEDYHEGFWFFNIYEDSDYIDLNNSVIDDYDPDADDHDITKFSLNEQLFDSIDEEKRLIFRPLRSHMGYTIVHQKVVDIFTQLNIDNIKFYKLSEWEDGMQFRNK